MFSSSEEGEEDNSAFDIGEVHKVAPILMSEVMIDTNKSVPVSFREQTSDGLKSQQEPEKMDSPKTIQFEGNKYIPDTNPVFVEPFSVNLEQHLSEIPTEEVRSQQIKESKSEDDSENN